MKSLNVILGVMWFLVGVSIVVFRLGSMTDMLICYAISSIWSATVSE